MQQKNNINYKNIGERIRKLRIQNGISQIELAKAIDVSQTHMSNIENGNTGISLKSAGCWNAVLIALPMMKKRCARKKIRITGLMWKIWLKH